LLLLSQSKQKRLTTSTNTSFAGRALRIAPQNPTGPTAQPAHAATQIPTSDASFPLHARVTRLRAQVVSGRRRSIRAKVTPC
jgi:hypothetical protein